MIAMIEKRNAGVSVVEMDTVKSARGCKKMLLTMIFRNSNFMLVFLMKDGTQESVLAVFDYLTEKLGLEALSPNEFLLVL